MSKGIWTAIVVVFVVVGVVVVVLAVAVIVVAVVPFVVALLGSLVVLWFGIRRGLAPTVLVDSEDDAGGRRCDVPANPHGARCVGLRIEDE